MAKSKLLIILTLILIITMLTPTKTKITNNNLINTQTAIQEHQSTPITNQINREIQTEAIKQDPIIKPESTITETNLRDTILNDLSAYSLGPFSFTFNSINVYHGDVTGEGGWTKSAIPLTIYKYASSGDIYYYVFSPDYFPGYGTISAQVKITFNSPQSAFIMKLQIVSPNYYGLWTDVKAETDIQYSSSPVTASVSYQATSSGAYRVRIYVYLYADNSIEFTVNYMRITFSSSNPSQHYSLSNDIGLDETDINRYGRVGAIITPGISISHVFQNADLDYYSGYLDLYTGLSLTSDYVIINEAPSGNTNVDILLGSGPYGSNLVRIYNYYCEFWDKTTSSYSLSPYGANSIDISGHYYRAVDLSYLKVSVSSTHNFAYGLYSTNWYYYTAGSVSSSKVFPNTSDGVSSSIASDHTKVKVILWAYNEFSVLVRSSSKDTLAPSGTAHISNTPPSGWFTEAHTINIDYSFYDSVYIPEVNVKYGSTTLDSDTYSSSTSVSGTLSFSATALPSGTSIIYVNAYDYFGANGFTTHVKTISLTVNVDNDPIQSSDVTYNGQSTIYGGQAVTIEFTITDTGSPITWELATDSSFNNIVKSGTINNPTGNDRVQANLNVSTWTEGSHSIYLRVKDLAHETWIKYNGDGYLCEVFVDRTAPTITLNSPSNNTWHSQSTVHLSWSVSDAEALSLITVNLYLDSYDPNSLVQSGTADQFTSKDLTLSDGEHVIYIEAIDAAGNINIAKIIVKIDTTPPTITITAPQNGSYFGYTGITIEWTFTETNFYKVEIYIDGVLNGTVTDPSITTYNIDLPEGVRNITVIIFDKAVNRASDSITIIVDLTKPIGYLSNYPSNFTEQLYVEASFYDLYFDSAELIVYRGSTQFDSYSTTTGTLSNGTLINITDKLLYNEQSEFKIKLIVYDKAGNNYTIEILVIVDRWLGTINVNYGTPIDSQFVYGTWNINSNWNTDEAYPERMELYIDNQFIINRTSISYNWDTTKYNDGPHNISIKYIDKAGHEAWYNFTLIVDNTAPRVEFISPNNDTWSNKTFIIDFNYTEEYPNINEIRLEIYPYNDYGNFTETTAIYEKTYPFPTYENHYRITFDPTTSGYREGIFYVKLVVSDHIRSTVKWLVIKYDANKPNYTIQGDLTTLQNDSTVTGTLNIGFVVDDYASRWGYENTTVRIEVYENQGETQPITLTATLTITGTRGNYLLTYQAQYDTHNTIDGNYFTIKIYITDPAGNTAKYTIKLIADNDPPKMEPFDAFISGGNEAISKIYFGVNNSIMNATIRANDRAGTLQLVQFKYDNNIMVEFTYTTNGWTYTVNQNYQDAIISISYSGDNYWLNATIMINTTKLTEGEHTVQWYGEDTYGHSNQTDILAIVFDFTPPQINLSAEKIYGKGTWGNNSYITGEWNITINATDAYLKEYRFYLNGTQKYNGTKTYNFDFHPSQYFDEFYVFKIIAVDLAGNEIVHVYYIYVDNQAPTYEILTANNSYVEGLTTISINVSDRFPVYVYMSFGSDPLVVYRNGTVYYGSYDTTQITDGAYTVNITIVSGLYCIEKHLTLYVDNTYPEIKSVSIENNTWYGDYWFNVTVDDLYFKELRIYVNGTLVYVNNTKVFSSRTGSDGYYIFTIEVEDMIGHVTKATYVIYVDGTAPNILISTQTYMARNDTFSFSVEDRWLTRFEVYLLDENMNEVALLYNSSNGYMHPALIDLIYLGENPAYYYSYKGVLNTTMFSDGVYYIKVVAYDVLNNAKQTSITIFDNTPPQLVWDRWIAVETPLGGPVLNETFYNGTLSDDIWWIYLNITDNYAVDTRSFNVTVMDYFTGWVDIMRPDYCGYNTEKELFQFLLDLTTNDLRDRALILIVSVRDVAGNTLTFKYVIASIITGKDVSMYVNGTSVLNASYWWEPNPTIAFNVSGSFYWDIVVYHPVGPNLSSPFYEDRHISDKAFWQNITVLIDGKPIYTVLFNDTPWGLYNKSAKIRIFLNETYLTAGFHEFDVQLYYFLDGKYVRLGDIGFDNIGFFYKPRTRVSFRAVESYMLNTTLQITVRDLVGRPAFGYIDLTVLNTSTTYTVFVNGSVNVTIDTPTPGIYVFNVSFHGDHFIGSFTHGSINAVDPIPPRIYSIVLNNTEVSYLENATIIVNASDLETNISLIVLYYTSNYGASWISVNASYNGTHYIFVIPRYRYGTNITYYVFAEDFMGNNVTSVYYSYVVVDKVKPVLESWVNGEFYPLENITIYANATDDYLASGIDVVYMDVYVSLNNDSWTYDSTYALTLGNKSLYSYSLEFSRGAIYVKVVLYALDKAGNERIVKLFFYIDKRPVVIDAPSNVTIQYKDSMNVTIFVKDNLTGEGLLVDYYVYEVNGSQLLYSGYTNSSGYGAFEITAIEIENARIKVKYYGNDVYRAAEFYIDIHIIPENATITINHVSEVQDGNEFTVSGKVKDDDGEVVLSGTIEIYLDYNGTMIYVGETMISGGQFEDTFTTIDLPNGEYTLYLNATANGYNIQTATATLRVAKTIFNLESKSDGYQGGNASIIVSVNDPDGIKNINVIVKDPTGKLVPSDVKVLGFNTSKTISIKIITTLENRAGNYTVEVKIEDYKGNNVKEAFTVKITETKLQLYIMTPENGTIVERGSLVKIQVKANYSNPIEINPGNIIVYAISNGEITTLEYNTTIGYWEAYVKINDDTKLTIVAKDTSREARQTLVINTQTTQNTSQGNNENNSTQTGENNGEKNQTNGIPVQYITLTAIAPLIIGTILYMKRKMIKEAATTITQATAINNQITSEDLEDEI